MITTAPTQKSTSRPQSKYWCFTINNWTNVDVPVFKDMEYLIYGREKGEDGTPHLQGFVVMVNRKMLTAMKKLLPRAHLEIAHGSPLEAATYCRKDMDYDEFGDLPLGKGKAGGQATADNYAETKRLAQEGNLDDIDPEHYIKHYNTLKRIITDNRPIPPDLDWEDGQTPNIWFYGPTGTGKSRRARSENPGSRYS